jgi:hypothetical protein
MHHVRGDEHAHGMDQRPTNGFDSKTINAIHKLPLGVKSRDSYVFDGLGKSSDMNLDGLTLYYHPNCCRLWFI